MIIDNFRLAMFQSCPAKYDLRINRGWVPIRKGAALAFGGAIHEGLATWYRTQPENPDRLDMALAAIERSWTEDPVDDHRTLGMALRLMRAYAEEWPIEPFTIVGAPDEPLIEQAFTLPTGMYLACQNPSCSGKDASRPIVRSSCSECGDPLEAIEYGGIFDGLVSFSSKNYVFEHKTTSQLGDRYFYQFRPNNQITGYCWAASQLSGRVVDGALVNALCVTRSGKISFARSYIGRTHAEVEMWLRDLWHFATALRATENSGVWPMATGSCAHYSGCEYREVHSTGVQIEREKILATNFRIEPWSHEARDEGKEAP